MNERSTTVVQKTSLAGVPVAVRIEPDHQTGYLRTPPRSLPDRSGREHEEEAARVETERGKAPIRSRRRLRNERLRILFPSTTNQRTRKWTTAKKTATMTTTMTEEWQKEAAARLAVEVEEHERQKKAEEEAEEKRIEDEETLKEEYKTQRE